MELSKLPTEYLIICLLFLIVWTLPNERIVGGKLISRKFNYTQNVNRVAKSEVSFRDEAINISDKANWLNPYLNGNVDIKSISKKMCFLWKNYHTIEDDISIPEKVKNQLENKLEVFEEFMKRRMNDSAFHEPSTSTTLIPQISRTTEPPSSANDELPEGCHFKDYDIQTNEVICSGPDITEVPRFKIRRITKLIFNTTSIQVVDKAAIKGLPMITELVFLNGVLMKFAFQDLVKIQPVLESFSIIHNSISTVSFSSFSVDNTTDQRLTSLSFENNMIVFLPEPPTSNELSLLLLTSLNFNNNPMCVLPGDIFFPLRASPVKKLYLKQSGIEEIGSPTQEGKSSPLAYMLNLELLDLSHNPYMSSHQLDKLLSPMEKANLTTLHISYNYYIEVPTSALKHVRLSLLELHLEASSINCLDGTSFPRMLKLKLLNLRFSRIYQMKPETFRSLPNLETLLLDGNALITLPFGLKLSKLTILSLSNNPLEMRPNEATFKLTNETFLGLGNLKRLLMSNVPLNKVDSSVFIGLTSLVFLDLSECSISSIDSYSFKHLNSLQYLDLSLNELTRITKDIFFGLKNAKYLDLSHNQITFHTVPVFPFKQATTKNLTRWLNLGPKLPTHNITSDQIFNHLPSLEILKIAYNEIKHFPPKVFNQLYHLRELKVSVNKLKSWFEPIFKHNNHLRVLLLDDNELHILSEAMAIDFSKQNLTVDLSDNSFTCSCSFASVEGELNGTVFLNQNQYTCFNGTNSIRLEDYLLSYNSSSCSKHYLTYPPDYYPEPYLFRNKFILYGSICASIILSIIIIAVSYKNRWYAKYWVYKMKVKVQYMNFKPESDAYDYDTFVCYAQADRQWVFEKLVSQLESSGSGLKVCVHERDFLVGEAITHNIIRSVEKSRKVIIVISKAFLKSIWCMFELQMASNKILDERKNKLIFILLESIEFDEQPKDLRLLLKSRTYISWIHDIDGQRLFWARLMRVIAKPTSINDLTVSESSDQNLNDEKSKTREWEIELSPVEADEGNRSSSESRDIKIISGNCGTMTSLSGSFSNSGFVDGDEPSTSKKEIRKPFVILNENTNEMVDSFS